MALRLSHLCLANRRAIQYQSKLRRRYAAGPSLRLPLQQTKAKRIETVQEILKAKNKAAASSSLHRAGLDMEQRLYSRGARLEREGVHASPWRNAVKSLGYENHRQLGEGVNTTYAMQGLGDLEPLRNSRSFGFSEREALKYDSPRDAMKYSPPPVPFTPLAARKLAEGTLWPRAPEPHEMRGVTGRELRYLRHRDNMSPSAQHFSDKLAYHLRRCFKACPAHIAEHIDFSQLILQEVIASRRSKCVYIVWKTVDPGARWEMEPHLLRLHYWVRRIILEKMKTRPNVPQEIHWVYDGDRIERELPHTLRREVQNFVGDVTSSLDTRVQYLKALDTVQQRMKDIPWFMPYLWSKEEKAAKVRQMRSDVEEFDRRRREAKAQQAAAEQAVQQRHRGSGRSSPAAVEAPPAYVR